MSLIHFPQSLRISSNFQRTTSRILTPREIAVEQSLICMPAHASGEFKHMTDLEASRKIPGRHSIPNIAHYITDVVTLHHKLVRLVPLVSLNIVKWSRIAINCTIFMTCLLWSLAQTTVCGHVWCFFSSCDRN